MKFKIRTNNYIVGKVSQTYKVKELIHKLIQNSIMDHTDGDMEQYIYLTLLNLNNEKLNDLYHKNQLRKFISQIIKNQRNSGKFYRQLTSKECTELDVNYDTPDLDSHNYMIDFVMDIFDNINFYHTGKTQEELRNDLSLTVLSLYIIHMKPKWKICFEFSIGMSTLNLLIRDGKNYIRNKYEKEYDEFLENKKGETSSPFL